MVRAVPPERHFEYKLKLGLRWILLESTSEWDFKGPLSIRNPCESRHLKFCSATGEIKQFINSSNAGLCLRVKPFKNVTISEQKCYKNDPTATLTLIQNVARETRRTRGCPSPCQNARTW